MKKVELLAPAGSFEALKAAVTYGADAVYLGGMRFGARAFANNFDEEEMIEAVKYCHIRGVKVYVTVNTLIYEDELPSVIEMIDFLYHAQVDALIIQDLGLFEILHERHPDFEIHCSTQMHIHNLDGVQFMKKQGASRVVLARETPIDIVRECCKEQIDIEVFVYGALCVSYSGQCLLSSIIGGRSGNRGECAQPCRMRYSLMDLDSNKKENVVGEYLLSPKDLFTIDRVGELIDAGITSFKIEGRMKRPEYVGEVVRVWRQAIDTYLSTNQYKLNKIDEDSLKKLFHRGFTAGHLFGSNTKALMNPVRPNHQGIVLGYVEKMLKGKVAIRLTHDLHQGDGIRILSKYSDDSLSTNFIEKDGLLVSEAKKGDLVLLNNPSKLRFFVNDQVMLTTDRLQCESIQKQIGSSIRRVGLMAYFNAKIGQKASFSLNDGIHQICVESDDAVMAAIKQPVTKDKIKELLCKISDTPYTYDQLQINIDSQIFISLKAINELRRKAIETLNNARWKVTRKSNQWQSEMTAPLPVDNLLAMVKNKSQAECFGSLAKLYSTSKTLTCIPEIYPISLRADEHSTSYTDENLIVTHVGVLNQKKMGIRIAGASLNATNSYALRFLHNHGVDGIEASLEADDDQIEAMIQGYINRYGVKPQVGKRIYGRRELMIIKGCVLNAALLDGTKTNCMLCQKKNYVLVNEKGKRFRFDRDDACHSLLLEDQPFESFTKPKDVAFCSINLTFENKEETEGVIRNVKEMDERI